MREFLNPPIVPQIFLWGESSSPNPRLCLFSAARTAHRFIPFKTHLYGNPIKSQPRRVRNHPRLVEIVIRFLSLCDRVASSGRAPLRIVRLTAALSGMTSCNLVYTFISFAWGAFMPAATETNALRRAVILILNSRGQVMSDAGKWGSGSLPQSSFSLRCGLQRLSVHDSQVNDVMVLLKLPFLTLKQPHHHECWFHEAENKRSERRFDKRQI